MLPNVCELNAELEALLDSEFIELKHRFLHKLVLSHLCIIAYLTPATTPDQPPPIINAVNILKEDLYRKTTGPVTRRSLLDEPALIPDYFIGSMLGI